MKWLIIALSLLIPRALGGDNICHLLPANNLHIPTNTFTGISASEFNEILKEFMAVNEPLAEKKGYKLVIDNKWNDDTVNASTNRSGKKWIINAYGGLARYEGMDPDTYMMVLCHELYHHLGGYPKKGWASNEGASDYGATLKGFRYLLKNGYKAHTRITDAPVIVKEKCSILHKSKIEINTCIQISLIGEKLANVLNSLSNNSKIISFSTPDQEEVLNTFNGHPNAQSRLDTYFSGAVCNKSIEEEFDDASPCPGACAEECGDSIGFRPRSWYKPKI